VNARRGKAMRAEPVSLPFEKQRVVMQPGMKRLQEKMLSSPNRLDAIGSDAFSKGLLDVPIA
jgi:phage terminase large subunit-like protein